MGGIDLDPASCEMANRTVKATRYYTKDNDGLTQKWKARSVWLNPPYAKNNALPNEQRSTVARWVEKLIKDHRSGGVGQAIMLLTAQTDAKWFALIWEYTVCFADHKVRFYLPHGDPSRPGAITAGHMLGTLFIYLGPNITSFVEHFTQFGVVITPDGVHRRPQPATQPTLF
jgi:hypothetical protein